MSIRGSRRRGRGLRREVDRYSTYNIYELDVQFMIYFALMNRCCELMQASDRLMCHCYRLARFIIDLYAQITSEWTMGIG